MEPSAGDRMDAQPANPSLFWPWYFISLLPPPAPVKEQQREDEETLGLGANLQLLCGTGGLKEKSETFIEK